MSPKAKKYRRPNIPAASAADAPVSQTETLASAQSAPAPKAAPRNLTTAIPVPTAQAFLRDLSWIGLTTLIVVILMIVAYFAVPR
jgi:hypothetical protein